MNTTNFTGAGRFSTQCSCALRCTPSVAHAPRTSQRATLRGMPMTRNIRQVRVAAQDEEYFDEGAAQVKRLLDRDRKEFMREDAAEPEYGSEFERPKSSNNGNESNGASTSQPSAYDEELSSMKNPMRQAFKSAPKKGAFGSSAKSPFGSESSTGFSNQKDMWAAMEPVEDDSDEPWWKQISFGQVAIVLSFLTITGLMLGTVWVTVKLGAVHFNEVSAVFAAEKSVSYEQL